MYEKTLAREGRVFPIQVPIARTRCSPGTFVRGMVLGEAATLGGVKVGDYAHGKLHKDSAGNEVITDAKFDKEAPRKQKQTPDNEPQKTPASKSKP